jgi:pimeloyl-ACP methyl ester carboxylesterase
MSRTIRALVCAVLLAGAVTVARAEAPVAKPATFETRDGVTIVGDFYPASGSEQAPLAVLLHMYHHDRSTWKPLVGPLHDAGFAVLAIDLRGHGESIKPADMQLSKRMEERDPKLFNAMHQDVAAAVAWAKDQTGVDVERLVVVGASVGCSVALAYCARDDRVDAVVCMSPGTNYLGVDSIADIKKTRDVPIMMFASEAERQAVDELEKIAENAHGNIVARGRIHGTRMFGQVKGIEQRIVKFLKTALRKK